MKMMNVFCANDIKRQGRSAYALICEANYLAQKSAKKLITDDPLDTIQVTKSSTTYLQRRTLVYV